jgi:hypothetical protein
MQQKQRLGLKCLLVVGIALSVCATSYAQTTSSTTVSESQKNHAQQDSETLKSLEIANIRLKAANETITLLQDRLKAKDATIEAREAEIALRKEQLENAKSANQDRAVVNTGDARLLQACEQQLARSDAEIARLRNPGFLRRFFNTDTFISFGAGYGIGQARK